MIAQNDARPKWSGNGHTQRTPAPSVSVRGAVITGARDVTRQLLRGQSVEGVSSRQIKAWKELGGPLAEIALWLRSHPEHAEVVFAYLRGEMMEHPAELPDAVRAEGSADAREEMAAAEVQVLLVLPASEERNRALYAAMREWARQLDLQAARSTELARVLREEAEVA